MTTQQNKKKVPVPFAMRMVPKVFPILEKLAPWLSNRFAWWLFFTPIRFQPPLRELEAASNANIDTFHADGKKLTYYTWGSGPIILMMHGWAGRGTQFHAFIQPLTKAGYQVISLDGPAHGKSEGKSTNVLEFASAIQALRNIVGPIEGFVGHSFGGLTGMYAVQHGLDLKYLISIGSPTQAEMLLTEFSARINGSERVRRFIEKRVVKRIGMEFKEISIQHLLGHMPPIHYFNIHDQDDREVSVSHQAVIAKQFPGVVTKTTSGLGHMRVLKSAEVVQAVLEYINKQKEPKQKAELVS